MSSSSLILGGAAALVDLGALRHTRLAYAHCQTLDYICNSLGELIFNLLNLYSSAYFGLRKQNYRKSVGNIYSIVSNFPVSGIRLYRLRKGN